MTKITNTLFWFAILILFNYILYIVYIDSMKDAPVNGILTSEERTARIMSIATGGGIPQTGLDTKELIIGNTKVIAEIADTEEKRRVGEMFRGAMGEKDAMLFIFDQEQPMGFWMKDTYIGLDILYIGSDSIIKHIHNNAKPLDYTSLPSIYPAQYVIEVRDDFVENFGIKVGDKVEGIY